MNYYIYRITNNLSGRYYLGARSTRNDPWKDSYMGSGTAIAKAIKKHTKENFSKLIVVLCENQKELYETEALFVTQEVVDDPQSYNLCLGGQGGVRGFKFSNAARKQIAKSITGRKWWTNGTCEKQTRECPGDDWKRGRMPITDETRKKLSISRNARPPASAETCKKISNSGKKIWKSGNRKINNQKVSVETREKLSIAHKKSWKSGNRKTNDKKVTAETRKKLSEKSKKMWKSNEHKEKIKKAITGQKRSDETRKKMSDAAKKRYKKVRKEKQGMADIAATWKSGRSSSSV